jgi:hypothetical protein
LPRPSRLRLLLKRNTKINKKVKNTKIKTHKKKKKQTKIKGKKKKIKQKYVNLYLLAYFSNT